MEGFILRPATTGQLPPSEPIRGILRPAPEFPAETLANTSIFPTRLMLQATKGETTLNYARRRLPLQPLGSALQDNPARSFLTVLR